MRIIEPEGEIWSALAIIAKAGIPVIMENFVRDLNDRYRQASAVNVSMSEWADGESVEILLGDKGKHYNEALDVLYKLSIEAVGRHYEMGASSQIQLAFVEALTRFHVEQNREDPLMIYKDAGGEFVFERYSTNLQRIHALHRSG